MDNAQGPPTGYQPPAKGYQAPVRQQPEKGYQYPFAPPHGALDSSQYPPVGRSGAASNDPLPDLGYDDNEYDDYDYGRSPISHSSADYGMSVGSNPANRALIPGQPYQSSYGQQSQDCSPSEFQCSTMSQCVPSTLQCDGEFDCMDGSDESSCGGRG